MIVTVHVQQSIPRSKNSVDSPALLLPPRSPQPILDNRTATPLTVRDFDQNHTKRARTCRSAMDSRSRFTLQLPQHRATKYRNPSLSQPCRKPTRSITPWEAFTTP